MRVWVIFLLFFAISFVVAYREESKKTAAEKTEEDGSLENLDSKEFEKAGKEAEKKKKETTSAKQKPSKQQEVDEDEAVAIGRTEEVGEKLCQALNDSTICAQIDAARPKLKTKDRKPVEADKDDDEKVEYVCDNKKEGMCTCSKEELDCSGDIDDYDKLDTADIVVNEDLKNLKIMTADFRQNRIRRLKKNHVLSKREDEVEKLDFEHNFINKIEAGVFEPFKSLHILKLGHNRITKFDKNHLSGLSGLHQLWLNNNQIKKLEDGTFKELKNLTKLILDGNKIPIKKELFEGLDNLEELSLDDCDIKVDTLDANVFDHLKQLKVLSMRKNPLQEVPKALKALDNLESLDLSETFIVELHEKCFDKDSKLKLIRMINSSLFAIQERALSGLRLEEIDMSNNKNLSEIHPDAFGMDGGENPTLLKKINFANGNLSTITEDTFYLSSLEEVAFGGNPWNCDCNTEFLLGEQYEKYKFKEPYPKCHFPKMLQSKNFFEVRADQACPASRKTRAVFRGVKVLAILLLLTVLCIASFMVYNKGYIQNFLKTARNGAPAFPSMTYSNLNNTTDDGRTLETDFQPRPEDV